MAARTKFLVRLSTCSSSYLFARMVKWPTSPLPVAGSHTSFGTGGQPLSLLLRPAVSSQRVRARRGFDNFNMHYNCS